MKEKKKKEPKWLKKAKELIAEYTEGYQLGDEKGDSEVHIWF